MNKRSTIVVSGSGRSYGIIEAIVQSGRNGPRIEDVVSVFLYEFAIRLNVIFPFFQRTYLISYEDIYPINHREHSTQSSSPNILASASLTLPSPFGASYTANAVFFPSTTTLSTSSSSALCLLS